jgi:hypothetical protein
VSDYSDRPRRSLLTLVRDAWQPMPISSPVIDHDLDEMMVLERVTEVTRFQIHQLEYLVSPGGGLRAWLRVNMLLALLLLIPAMFVVPVVTSLAGQFATLTAYLYQASVNLFYTVLTLIGTVASVLAFISILKFWLGNGGRGSRRR